LLRKRDRWVLGGYIDNMVIPYINIALKIFDLFNVPKKKLYDLAKCGFIIDFIYDLEQDIQLGYINISKEEIERYNIDLKKLDSKNLNLWISDKIIYIERKVGKFEQEIRKFKGLSKIFAYSLLKKRKTKLKTIKKNLMSRI